MTTVAVHDGTFHADDVFAIAILKRIHPDLKVVRTRDPKMLASADLRVDVGMKHNPMTGDFDHHQKEGAGERSYGVPFAAAGLVWQHVGKEIAGSERAFRRVDGRLIASIDATDNGIDLYNRDTINPYTLSDVIDCYNPQWDESREGADAAFLRAVEWAGFILEREIGSARSMVKADEIVKRGIEQSSEDIVILSEFAPWKRVLAKESRARFCVYPVGDEWRAQGVPQSEEGFTTRASFPEAWGGLEKEELQRASGVKDATFCHRGLFIAGAKSRAGAMLLATRALKKVD